MAVSVPMMSLPSAAVTQW